MFEATIAGKESHVILERMTEHDLLEVVGLEEMSNLSAWGWDAYHTELRAGASLMLVARSSGAATHQEVSIVGFIVAREMAGEIHINNVAVRPDSRGRGIGRHLLQAALSWGREKGVSQVVLEVRAGNEAAQELYRSCGFQVIGRRRGYYKSPVEDALLMSVSLE